MLGKPEWFRRRKYGGWGFWPAGWQGVVYIIVVLAVLFALQLIPDSGTRTIAMIVWGAVFAADAAHIMVKLPKDERERLHEAVADRNALWAIVVALAFGVGYQAAVSVPKGSLGVDPVIIAALIAGVVVKALTNIYLDRKN